jgi:hypothetical protein
MGNMGNCWTNFEKDRIKALGITRSISPEKLTVIVEHFKARKPVYKISVKPLSINGMVIQLDHKTAEKYKEIVESGQLDWVLERPESPFPEILIGGRLKPVNEYEFNLMFDAYNTGKDKVTAENEFYGDSRQSADKNFNDDQLL